MENFTKHKEITSYVLERNMDHRGMLVTHAGMCVCAGSSSGVTVVPFTLDVSVKTFGTQRHSCETVYL